MKVTANSALIVFCQGEVTSVKVNFHFIEKPKRKGRQIEAGKGDGSWAVLTPLPRPRTAWLAVREKWIID